MVHKQADAVHVAQLLISTKFGNSNDRLRVRLATKGRDRSGLSDGVNWLSFDIYSSC